MRHMDETPYTLYRRVSHACASREEAVDTALRLARVPFYSWRRLAVRPFDPRMAVVRPDIWDKP